MLSTYESEILDYVSSVGLRADNTRINKAIYSKLVKITYMVLNNKAESVYIDYLHFIDCVANNILHVPVYNQKDYGEPKGEFLELLYAEFKELYNNLAILG